MKRTHGMSRTKIYQVWSEMRRRCTKPNASGYKYYGGRGITYAKEWDSFEQFYKWAIESGYKSNGKRGEYTIDRIDCNGNYCPENCRWVPASDQSKNTRRNRRIKINGEEHILSEWSKILGFSSSTIKQRIDKFGFSEEEALTIGLNENNKHYITYNGETHMISEWSLLLGGTKNMVAQRLRKGWSLDKALTTPVIRKTHTI